MAAFAQFTAILAASVLGALAEFVVVLRRYNPPGEDANPLFDGLVFFALFVPLFLALGLALAYLEGLGDLGLAVLGAVVAVGLYSVYSILTDHPSIVHLDEATRTMALVGSGLLVLYPPLLLLV
ncbi:MAG: hypothetical protein ABEI39_01820 [Halobacteriales archaeon]